MRPAVSSMAKGSGVRDQGRRGNKEDHLDLAPKLRLERVPGLHAENSLEKPADLYLDRIDLNEPTAVSPVLITGNSRLTHEVLLAVLSTTSAPMWLLAVDTGGHTGGHTVDMSLVYQTLTPEAIANALQADDSRAYDPAGRIILPGLAEGLAASVSEMLGRPVEIGPICAAELPLFFAQDWVC